MNNTELRSLPSITTSRQRGSDTYLQCKWVIPSWCKHCYFNKTSFSCGEISTSAVFAEYYKSIAWIRIATGFALSLLWKRDKQQSRVRRQKRKRAIAVNILCTSWLRNLQKMTTKALIFLCLMKTVEQRFPTCDTCTPRGTFAYLKGYI